MTVSVTHTFHSAVADEAAAAAAGEVLPSHWNAGHTVSGLLSTSTPLVESGSGSAGSGTTASKDDHVHPAAGGASPVSLVGPYSIAWNTTDVVAGALIAAIPADKLVLEVYALIKTDWDGGAGQSFIQAGFYLGPYNFNGFDLFNASGTHNGFAFNAPLLTSNTGAQLRKGPAVSTSERDLTIQVQTDGAGLTAGALDVYLLLGTATAP